MRSSSWTSSRKPRARRRSGSSKHADGGYASTDASRGRNHEREQRSEESRPAGEGRLEDDDRSGIPEPLGRGHGGYRGEGRAREEAPGAAPPIGAQPKGGRQDRPIEPAARPEEGSGGAVRR